MKESKLLILKKIKSHYGMKSDADFARFLGIKPNSLANWYARNTMDYELVVTKCEDIDANWLFSGEGEMLKKSIPKEVVLHDSPVDQLANTLNSFMGELSVLTQGIFQHHHIIPQYDFNLYAPLESLFQRNVKKPIDYLSVPNVDGALSFTGDSMFPVLKSGDILFYSYINNLREDLHYGGMYLLDLSHDDQVYITVKCLEVSDRGDDWVKLVSCNNRYSPRDIPLSSVRSAAYIKGFLQVCVN